MRCNSIKSMYKKWILLSLIGISSNLCLGQQYASKNVNISFLCTGLFSDIEAFSKDLEVVVDLKKNTIQAQIPMNSFKFDKVLNAQHFNQWFLETKEFPKAYFKGSIEEDIDLEKDGIYSGIIKGVLTVKNIERNRYIPYTISIKKGIINIESNFDVSTLEYHIELPEIFRYKISETIFVNLKGVIRAR